MAIFRGAIVSAVIIVRYESDIDSFERIVRKLSEKYSVYVFDNSKSICKLPADVYYYHAPNNDGLAVALNHCINKALDDGETTCVYFDQDSEVCRELIDSLISRFKRLESSHSSIFALGPQPVSPTGELYEIHPIDSFSSDNVIEASEIITSGMTFNPKVAKEIGLFDEKLFLDLVDFEACWRARDKGFKVFVDKSILMNHEVGSGSFRFLGRLFPVSSPLRNYYQMRNVLYVSLNSARGSKVRVIYFLSRRVANFLLNLIFANNRWLRFKYNLVGVKDALFGRMGKINE